MNILYTSTNIWTSFLIVAQVVMIAGIVLLLIYLLAKRIERTLVRQASFDDSRAVVDIGNSPNADRPPVDTSESLRKIAELELQKAEADKTISELQQTVDRFKGQTDQIDAAAREKSELEEKIKYLESKLLEYEILQEEISTLSSLKHENEDLKRQLVERNHPLSNAPIEPTVFNSKQDSSVPETAEKSNDREREAA